MGSYALVENGVIVNIVSWDGSIETWQPPEGLLAVEMPDGVNAGIGWTYDGTSFHAPSAPEVPNEELAANVRRSRDGLLRSVYDPGILMAQRAFRLASTDTERAYANGKIAELDAYAEALSEVPEQAGFPSVIVWPTIPTV